MFRGFRWQLLGLIIAAVIFGLSFLTTQNGDDENPTPVPPATLQPLQSVPTGIPTLEPTSVPQAVVEVVQPIQSAATVITYREALVGSIDRLNPLFAGLNSPEADITSLIFEGLVRINEFGEPQPALAKSWVISSDKLEYVFELRDDVLWQDGLPFNAADVIYTMSILRSPDFPGAPELGAFWRSVETEQLGDHLVRFRLAQPLASFLDALRIGILPAHALQGTTAQQLATHPFNLSPIGTGPYQLEALRTSGDSDAIEFVDLRAAPVYRQRPEGQTGYALERLRFQLFESFVDAHVAFVAGDVDALAGRNREQRLDLLNTSANIYTATDAQLGVLIFNWVNDDKSYFRDQRMRQALAMGLDRSTLIDRNLGNFAIRADSPLFPGSWAYSTNFAWPPYSPELTRQLLEALTPRLNREGDAADSTGSLVSFEILTPDDATLTNLAREVAAQWSQYNLNVTVTALPASEYQSRLENAAFDVALVEISLGGSADPDVYPFWDSGQYPDGKNYGGMNDRRLSEFLERARRDPNGINRAQLYADFQREFIERMAAIPLYYPLYTYATTPTLSGLQLGFISQASDRFLTIQNWTLPAR